MSTSLHSLSTIATNLVSLMPMATCLRLTWQLQEPQPRVVLVAKAIRAVLEAQLLPTKSPINRICRFQTQDSNPIRDRAKICQGNTNIRCMLQCQSPEGQLVCTRALVRKVLTSHEAAQETALHRASLCRTTAPRSLARAQHLRLLQISNRCF